MKKIILSILIIGVTAFAEVNINACTGCHGQNFDKSAMGKSKIVSEMSKENVSNALLGYKEGTYGGPMKNIMKGQVSKYSDEELQNTNIGKSTFVDKVKSVAKNRLEKTEVVFSEFEKYAYKSGNNCWVVDYKNKKSNLISCKVLDKRSKIDRHPMQPGMPSFVFRDLFK